MERLIGELKLGLKNLTVTLRHRKLSPESLHEQQFYSTSDYVIALQYESHNKPQHKSWAGTPGKGPNLAKNENKCFDCKEIQKDSIAKSKEKIAGSQLEHQVTKSAEP